MRTLRKSRPSDRLIPGIGRLTIRTRRMSVDARNDLDRCITRALQAGHLEQLRLLKERQVAPQEFLAAARTNTLLALKPRHSVRPLVAQWLKASDLRESSRSRYLQSWKFMLATLSSDDTLDALTDSWWEDFAAEREVKNATLNRDRAALLAFRTWAEMRGYTLPRFKSERRIEEPNASDILTPAQVDAVRRHCRPDRWPFFWTLFDTGARQGEVLNLRAEDISPYKGTVAFPSRPGSKGRGKNRHVPVSQGLVSCLGTLALLSGGGRLFPYGRTTIREWWMEICQMTAIRGVTLHGIRATFITRALDSGESPLAVQKLVGHSSLATTMRYYRNTQQDLDAAGRIREAVGIAATVQDSGLVTALVPADSSA
jgi:integrase/recombinase XerC